MESIEESIFPERRIIYAAFSGRLVAVIIDSFLVFIPLAIFWHFMHPGVWVVQCINLIISWLYNAIQESGPRQATIGKNLMNIIIVDLNYERISFDQATIRHFSKYISGLILCIGYFMMLWDKQCQTLHDKIAGTLAIVG